MNATEIRYSVNSYDEDGDRYDKNIMIHVDNYLSLRFASLDEYDAFIVALQIARSEIRVGWNSANEC